MRLIDADALIAELQKDEERFDKEAEDCRKNSRNYTDCYIQAMSSRADGIRDAIVEVYDALTIEPKRGAWIEINIKDYKAKCSCCGTWSPIMGRYCPNCGADMREREGE